MLTWTLAIMWLPLSVGVMIALAVLLSEPEE